MNKKTFILFLCAVTLGYFAISAFVTSDSVKQTDNTSAHNGKTVIIDPGHGGVDGGAVSADGIVEKSINLNISMKLKSLCELAGINVIMTRETDISIHDSNADTIKKQKTSDLHNRLKIADSHPEAILVSVHQNKYSGASSCGMQVFYSGNAPESKILADCIQTYTVSNIQKSNDRDTKQITKAVYLIYNAKQPAVLVECGFLSNREEAEKLNTASYQSEIAYGIFGGIINFYKEQGK